MKSIKLLPEIKRKLKRLKVGIVYLYGSHAEKAAHPLSDFDIGVVFCDKKMVQKAKEQSLKLGAEFDLLFDKVFSTTEKNPAQTTFLQAVPIELQKNAIIYGKVIYEISPEFRANYEEYVLLRYADFQPLLSQFYKDRLGVKYV